MPPGSSKLTPTQVKSLEELASIIKNAKSYDPRMSVTLVGKKSDESNKEKDELHINDKMKSIESLLQSKGIDVNKTIISKDSYNMKYSPAINNFGNSGDIGIFLESKPAKMTFEK